MAIDVNELNGLQGDAFRAIIPQEIATQPYMKGVESFGDFVKKFDGSQKLIGSSERIPAPDAPPDQWQAFFAKAGRPEKPEGYEIPKIEGVPEDFVKKAAELGKLRQLLHASDITAYQARQFLPQFLKEMYQAEIQEQQVGDAEFNKTMDAIFGQDRQTVLEKGKAVLGQYIPENLKAHFASLDPKALAIVLAATEGIIKKHVNEDGFRPGKGMGGGNTAVTKESIIAAMTEIYKDPAFKDAFVDRAKNATLVAKMEQLREQLKKFA